MGKIAFLCGITATLLVTLAGYLLYSVLNCMNWTDRSTAIRVLASSFLLLAAAIFGDISSLQPSDSHTVKSLFTQYVMVRLIPLVFTPVYSRFLEDCRNIQSSQNAFLRRVIDKNGDTVYGREFNLRGIRNRDDFIRRHPLTNYSHFESFFERTCNGENAVMSPEPLAFVGMTSGTTGKFKKFPIPKGVFLHAIKHMGIGLTLFGKHLTSLRRYIILRYKPKEMYTSGGIKMGSISSVTAPLLPHALTPKEAARIEDNQAQTYVHALFALAERDVVYLEGMLSTMVYSFFKKIMECAAELCKDIQKGEISEKLNIDDITRRAINQSLKADPERAKEVELAIQDGAVGLAKRLWPHLEMIGMTHTGGFQPQADYLRQTFLKDIFGLGFFYAATEGTIGIMHDTQRDPMEWPRRFIFPHYSAFFEFIPEDDIHNENPRTYFLDQLEKDKKYEIVITNKMGLYRYRMGDIIKVVDFMYQNPIYEFQYRVGQLLNLKTEKTSEEAFYKALLAAETEWKDFKIEEYSATESVNVESLEGYQGDPDKKCYVVFLEIAGAGEKCQLSAEAGSLIDEKLCQIAQGYKACRDNGSIDPMEVIQVKTGTFLKMKAMVIQDTNNQQYKTPRALRKPELLAFLLENDTRHIKL